MPKSCLGGGTAATMRCLASPTLQMCSVRYAALLEQNQDPKKPDLVLRCAMIREGGFWVGVPLEIAVFLRPWVLQSFVAHISHTQYLEPLLQHKPSASVSLSSDVLSRQ
ncbi:hypothetical protein M758_UG140000 [Ceratodon purpureus]|nr:hypothetical protein M758_UG140000 [Ceratodon purpureus]